MKGVLRYIAKLQHTYPYFLAFFLILITLILATGLPKLEVQSDFSKENPRHLPAFVLTDRINDEFGGETGVIMILETTTNDESERIDLREPELINFLLNLEEDLIQDSRVVKTSSISRIFKGEEFETREDVKEIIDSTPGAESLFNDDFQMTLLTITTNIGEAYEDIVPFEAMLEDTIAAQTFPGGVEYSITGGPSFGKIIRETVFADGAKTILIASLGIFLLLMITERSLKKSLLIFLPLLVSLIWAGGVLGHIELKLSIACVALGSIILGLGVEYGVFMLTRYHEERYEKKKSQSEATEETVSNIGAALLGSGTTTVAGFLALTFSITPMMQVLGLSLAIGILCAIASAIFVAPLLLVLEERYETYKLKKSLPQMQEKKEFFERSS
jgi:hypothetical protein